MRKWKFYMFSSSHTDIGYTERQEKLKRYHRDFVIDAIKMFDDIHSGKLDDCKGYKFQTENLWQMQNFLDSATSEQKDSFFKYVKSGEIGISGNYLNMTGIIESDILSTRLKKSLDVLRKEGIKVESGMTADVDGYPWGYCDMLYENGVKNLYCALHSHHGLVPLYKKQRPYKWIGQNGGEVLVWVGDHYHFGCELGMSPFATTSYSINDDVTRDFNQRRMFISDKETTWKESLEVAKKRIPRYLEQLEREDYPYDIVPINVAGAITDNAPPYAKIAKRVKELNEAFEGKIEFQMATLEEFFEEIRKSDVEIPEYKGEFVDWWADGVGSTPNTLKVFREAQRRYDICKKIDKDGTLGDKKLVDQAEEDLTLYAEHTWGYSSSVTEPWNSLVGNLEKKKDAYAANADTAIATNLDNIMAKLGEITIKQEREMRYKIINPHPTKFKGTVKLYIEYWEYIDGVLFNEQAKIYVTDEKTKEEFKCQGRGTPRAFEVEVAVELAPNEEKTVRIHQKYENTSTTASKTLAGAEGVCDVITGNENPCMPYVIDTPYFNVNFSQERGISSIVDKTSGKQILKENELGAFSGVYEITEGLGDDKYTVRRNMGRNRSSIATKRDFSKLKDVSIIENGEVCVIAKISFELEGTNFYYVYLKVYKTCPIIEARVCFHKKSVWDPENLYVALPFTTTGEDETFIDESGSYIRPGIDQLPGSCQEFYLLQNTIARQSKDLDVLIAVKDAPLICFGERKAKPIELCDTKNSKLNKAVPYSWLMNNFWETNFKADLGGFYEFTYSLITSDHKDIKEQIETCRSINEGVLGFYI